MTKSKVFVDTVLERIEKEIVQEYGKKPDAKLHKGLQSIVGTIVNQMEERMLTTRMENALVKSGFFLYQQIVEAM